MSTPVPVIRLVPVLVSGRDRRGGKQRPELGIKGPQFEVVKRLRLHFAVVQVDAVISGPCPSFGDEQ